MKIIDLLNKISNDEKPPKIIKFCGKIYEYKGRDYYSEEDEYLTSSFCLDYVGLNNEVEILEENKKIEKIDPIDYCHSTDTSKDMVLVEKINELIDKIIELEDKENGSK